MTAHAGPTGGKRERGGPVDLLAHVARDLRDCTVHRRDRASAWVAAPDGTTFEVEVAVERRRLMTLQESLAVVHGPEVTGSGAGSLLLHHTGQIRRRGLAIKLRGHPDDEVERLRDRFLADGRLEAASLPLDVTRFRVLPHAGRWRAELRLMGGSHVRTRIPPGGSYVRLAEDQVAALLGTVRILTELLPVDPPALALDDDLVAEAETARSRRRTTHLPGRPTQPDPPGE